MTAEFVEQEPEGEAPMLDVHPPHAPVHGVRDFLLHLFTITVGLLIALSLEAMVEAMHHRHLVHQARENIREEVKQNQETLAKDKRGLEGNKRLMAEQIALLNAYAKNPKQPAPGIQLPWFWNSPYSAAFDTARDTQTLALMPYDEVQSYSALYGQQAMVNTQASLYIRHQTDAATPLLIHGSVSDLTPAQLDKLIEACAVSLNDIQYTESLMVGLERGYASLLAKE